MSYKVVKQEKKDFKTKKIIIVLLFFNLSNKKFKKILTLAPLPYPIILIVKVSKHYFYSIYYKNSICAI
jgi:hypothetical protein